MKLISQAMLLTAFGAATMLAQPFGALTAGTPPDPATMIANRVARLTNLLDLTTAQQTQATTIFTNAQTAITPLQTTISTDFTSLQTAVKANATSTIDQLSTAIGGLQGQILAIQNKADAAFYAILTTAQQTTLNSAGGPGGPGPGGPGFGPHGRGPRPVD